MRRRSDTLLPLEVDILEVAAAASRSGDPWVYGFAVARELRDQTGAQRLTGHGTLYKALARLAGGGLLDDRWEEPEEALAEGRPRRRLYRISGAGQQALAAAVVHAAARHRPKTRVAPA